MEEIINIKDPRETQNHLFFKARMLKKYGGLLHLNCWDQSKRLMEIYVGYPLCYFFTILSNYLHSIWTERNGRKYGETQNTASQMVQYIYKNVKNKNTWRPCLWKGLRIETLLISIRF